MGANNTSTNGTDSLKVYYWEQILLAIMVGLIAIIGLIGNSMIILAVALSKKLHTCTNVFVTSLSVADLLTSFTLIWYAVGALGKEEEWPITEAYWICQATGFMIYAFTGISTWTLGIIAINRVLYITKQKTWCKRVFTPWKIVFLVVLTWVIPSASLVIPVAADEDVKFGYNKEYLFCGTAGVTVEFFSIQILIALAFPLPAIVVSYALIYAHVKKTFRVQKQYLANFPKLSVPKPDHDDRDNPAVELAMAEGGDNTPEEANRPVPASTSREEQILKQELEITKNLFIVVVVFSLCFLPYFVVLSFHKFATVRRFVFYIRILPVSNSAINFVIYASKHPDFKIVLRHMMRRSYADIPQPSSLLKYLLLRRGS